jgi:hypothetical protein
MVLHRPIELATHFVEKTICGDRFALELPTLSTTSLSYATGIFRPKHPA